MFPSYCKRKADAYGLDPYESLSHQYDPGTIQYVYYYMLYYDHKQRIM